MQNSTLLQPISSDFHSYKQAMNPNPPPNQSVNPEDSHSTDYAPYPQIDPNDVVPPPATGKPSHSAAVMASDAPPQETIDSVKDVLGKWGKKAADATKKGQDCAGEVWQHYVAGVSNCYVFKSRLQEYAQKAGLATPIYHTIKEGPSHEPVFRSTVVINEKSYHSLTGFLNRKAAEQSAAEVALIEIAKTGATDRSISHPVHETGLCKNLLQEYAQKMNYAIPSYVCKIDETKARAMFSCTVDIGGIKYIGAAAKTKKEAELKAAKTALLAIKLSTPDPDRTLDTPYQESVYTVVPTKRKEPEQAVGETDAKVKTNKKKKFRVKRRKKKVEMTRGEVGDVKTNDLSCDDELKLNGESILVSGEG